VALLPILTDENPRLRLKSHKVAKFDKSLRDLAQNMFETLEEANGWGLAAPQIGLLQRMLVIDVPKDSEYDGSDAFRCAIVNPEIIKSGGVQIGDEGCLSVPGWFGEVKRYKFLTVRGQDVYGKPVRFKLEGLPARVMQHEIDHLDGILFTDKLIDVATLHRPDQEEPQKSKIKALVKAG
jgi:peptide deformylase